MTIDKTEIQDRLQTLIRQALRQPRLVIDRSTTALMVDGWDSLAHARLILLVEESFQVTLPGERLFDLDAVGDLIDLLAERLAGKDTRLPP